MEKLLKPFQNKYYQVLEKDCTTFGGFQHSKKLYVETIAPDWDPDPNINCGRGLHVVKRHPLFAFRFISRENPIYAEVIVKEPVLSSYGTKYRCKSITKIRWVTDKDPEFDSKLLAEIAGKNDSWSVREAAVNKLDNNKT